MRLIDTEKAWKTAQRIYSDPVLLHAIKNTLDATETEEAVVLPCGSGQTVWVVGSKRIVECFVDEISFGVAGLFYLLSFDCDSDCDGCPFDSWKQDYMSGEWGCDGECGQTGISGEEFGKTIFLTRAEAEAALAKMKGGAENA